MGFPAPCNFESLTVGGISDVAFEIWDLLKYSSKNFDPMLQCAYSVSSARTVSPVHVQCLHYEDQAVSVVCSEHVCAERRTFSVQAWRIE